MHPSPSHGGQSASCAHPSPCGQHSPLPQHTNPGAQETSDAPHCPPSHRRASQGLAPVPQSASATHFVGASAGQHAPSPQHEEPGTQSTTTDVHTPSTQAAPAPVQGSRSAQSASLAHEPEPGPDCAAVRRPVAGNDRTIAAPASNRNAARRFPRRLHRRARWSNAMPSMLSSPRRPFTERPGRGCGFGSGRRFRRLRGWGVVFPWRGTQRRDTGQGFDKPEKHA